MVFRLKKKKPSDFDWCLKVTVSDSLSQNDRTCINWPKQRGSHDGVMADSFPFCSSARTGNWSAKKHLPLMNTEAY